MFKKKHFGNKTYVWDPKHNLPGSGGGRHDGENQDDEEPGANEGENEDDAEAEDEESEQPKVLKRPASKRSYASAFAVEGPPIGYDEEIYSAFSKPGHSE